MTIRFGEHALAHVLFGRAHRNIDSERLRDFEAWPRAVHDDRLPHSHFLAQFRQQDSQGARAHYDHRVALFGPAQLERVDAACQRLGQGGVLERNALRDLGERPAVPCEFIYFYVFSKAAWKLITHREIDRAVVDRFAMKLVATPARKIAADRHAVTGGEPAHVLTHIDDLSRRLVPHDGRWRNARAAVVEDAQIGAAYRAGRDLDEDVVRADLRIGYVLDGELSDGLEYGGLHRSRNTSTWIPNTDEARIVSKRSGPTVDPFALSLSKGLRHSPRQAEVAYSLVLDLWNCLRFRACLL